MTNGLRPRPLARFYYFFLVLFLVYFYSSFLFYFISVSLPTYSSQKRKKQHSKKIHRHAAFYFQKRVSVSRFTMITAQQCHKEYACHFSACAYFVFVARDKKGKGLGFITGRGSPKGCSLPGLPRDAGRMWPWMAQGIASLRPPCLPCGSGDRRKRL